MRLPSAALTVVLSTATALVAQPPAPPQSLADPIAPPARALPSESESARVTKFSFIAYGDTRSGSAPDVPGDGQILQEEHSKLMDIVLTTIKSRAKSGHPVRFVVQSGDAVLRGANGAMWNTSFTPIIERLTAGAGIPYFLAAGNHDVTGMPLGSPGRDAGLRNTLNAISKLIPPDGSPRRLAGYPTYAFGYGNLFAIVFDSNIAADPAQLAWVASQLERLDRRRYRHIAAFFHHPAFSSGPHGSTNVEPATAAVRDTYMALFRKHHVDLIVAGHEHLFEHWVERYEDGGRKYRLDQLVTGGGGAPTYIYGGEPSLDAYLAANANLHVTVQHLVRPGSNIADNPHHFVIVEVDGDRLSVEVVSSGAAYAPYGGKPKIDLVDRTS